MISTNFHPSSELSKKIEWVRRLLREEIESLCMQYDSAPQFSLLKKFFLLNHEIEHKDDNKNLAFSPGSISDYLTRARFELLLVLNTKLTMVEGLKKK